MLKENARIAVFRGEFDFEAGVNVQAEIAANVVFDERNDAPSVRSEPVITALIAIADFIGDEAMPELAALFPDSDWRVQLGPWQAPT